MNFKNQLKTKLPFLLVVLMTSIFVPQTNAQDAAAGKAAGNQNRAAGKLGDHYVPLDGIMMLDVRPADILAAENLHLLPMEIAEAWSLDNIGIGPSQCEAMRFVMATPAMGPQIQPFAALIVKLRQPSKVTELNPQLISDTPEEIDGHTCYAVKGPPGVVLHQVDPQTIILASSGYLDAVLDAAEGSQSGPLAKLSAVVSNKGQATMLFAIEPVRPMINGALQMFGQQLPPQMVGFIEIPNLLDAMMVRLDVNNAKDGLEIGLLATDDAAAEKLETIVMDGFDMGRSIALSQLEASLVEEGPIPDATRAYGQRISEKIGGLVRPERKGRTLTYRLSPAASIFMPALIAGGIGASQEAFKMGRAPRQRGGKDMSLKQIGLAMHNHHSAYKKLPAAVNRDADGKPLLSWRVHILPFIEQQGLYKEFHLDEPWDSEHNIKLLDRMPEVYSHPDFETAAGKTVFQVPIGDGLMFNVEKQTRFRDILDGLSNTIMVVTTDADAAVEWSKPQDLEIDLENPSKSLGMVDGSVSVLMGDGAVRSVIDDDNLSKLFTKAGKEIIR